MHFSYLEHCFAFRCLGNIWIISKQWSISWKPNKLFPKMWVSCFFPSLLIGSRSDCSDKTVDRKGVSLKSYTSFKKKKKSKLNLWKLQMCVSKSFHCFCCISFKRAIPEMDRFYFLIFSFLKKDHVSSSRFKFSVPPHFKSYPSLCVIPGQFSWRQSV